MCQYNKKLILNIVFALFTFSSFAQMENKIGDNSNVQPINPVPFRLYPTQNIWTFIKLDTRNGKMWQVQFSMKTEGRFETYLNLEPIVSKENEVNDRFTLYPTQNIYTFILLDQLNGKTWQVQWSTDPGTRGLIPIQ
jgi:hypothetical protein